MAQLADQYREARYTGASSLCSKMGQLSSSRSAQPVSKPKSNIESSKFQSEAPEKSKGKPFVPKYVSKGITHPVFYGDLVYKLRRVKNESNFISSGSKIVKRFRRRQYDPEIIEKTIGLVLGPFTALYRSFLKRCTLTNKAVGTI